MSKNESDGFNPEGFRRGGYQPLQEGYTPDNQKGYVPTSGTSLPKAPTGGTGQTRPVGGNDSSAQDASK